MNFQAAVEITSVVRRWRGYPDYKDSGVDWLRKIPAQWEAKKIKRLCLVKRGASPRPIEDPIYFDDKGEYSWVRISDVTASTKYLERTEQRLSEHGKSKSVPLEPGELFLSIAATVGKPIITKIKCCIHDGFVYFVGLKQNREYLFYLFSSGELYKGIGKTGTQLNLNTDTIGDIRIPLPSLAEQNVVVAFLDRETAKIDALVAKKERLMDLLQEKRAALITRAVTKGLDLNVPMKDSGVEWLGEIPAHWEMKGLRHVTRINQGLQMAQSARFSEPGPNRFEYITIKSIHAGDQGNKEYIENPPRSVICNPEDILLARTGATGEVISGQLGAFHNNFFKVEYDSNQVNRRYLVYYLTNSLIKEHFLLLAGTTTIPDLNHGEFLATPFVGAPIAEQLGIATFLDSEAAKVDTLIAKIREGIDKLNEYRTALISAAVTGKIDVREDVVA